MLFRSKRDEFPFCINRLPFLSSNIPTNMFYASISAEILRIARVSSSIDNFIYSFKVLIKRVKKQGATHDKLSKVLKKTYGRQQPLKQFSNNSVEFVTNILG